MLFLYTASAEAPCTVEEKNTAPSEELHQLATLIGRLSFFSTRTDLGDYIVCRVGWETCQLARCLATFTPARLLLDIQAALKLTETVSPKSVELHFHRNVHGAPCNASLAVLPLPGVYRNEHPSIVSVDGAVMISGGNPCLTS